LQTILRKIFTLTLIGSYPVYHLANAACYLCKMCLGCFGWDNSYL